MANNKSHEIILTFDFEYWHESSSIKKYLIGNEKESLDDFTEKILMMLSTHSATATFFVSGNVAQTEPGLIKKIFDAGHEIGVHSWDHKPLWFLNPEQFASDTQKLIEAIEKITGKKPIGHRAANFSLDNRTKWALPILKKCNFAYDSSVFPFQFSRTIFFMYRKFLHGVKSNMFRPYSISSDDPVQADNSSKLLEIPLSIFHFGFFKLPLTGGIYIRIIPWMIFKSLLKLKLGKEPACIHFHPYDLAKQIPDVSMPKIKKFIKYFNIGKTEKKLEYILGKYNCVSVENFIAKLKRYAC